MNVFVGQLQNLTEPLAPLFTPLAQLAGFQDLLGRAGIQTNISLGNLLTDALDATGHGDAGGGRAGTRVGRAGHQRFADHFHGLDHRPGELHGDGRWGGLQLPSLPTSNFLQQLGGGYATLAAQPGNVGIALPSEGALLGALLGGSANVSLFTYTLPAINVNQQVLNETLATIGTPIPGVTLNGEIVGSLNFQVGDGTA